MHLLTHIFRIQLCLTALFMISAASTSSAQDGLGADVIRDSGNFLRESGFSAVGSLRNVVEFRAFLGCRRSVQVDDRDEIWLVDARQSHFCPSDLSCVNVNRLHNGNWCPAQLEDLACSHLMDSSKETVVFIHGHQTDARWSLTRGMQVYRNLFKSCYPRKPIRFIVWQWKSERESLGRIQDYNAKSDRSVKLGTTLALTLARFHDRNVTIIGYSLGAQIALSAMQIADPSHLAGNDGYKLALIAPALNCAFTLRGANSPTPNSQINRTYIFYNKSDRALKIHDLICRREFGAAYVPLQQLVQKQFMSLGQIRHCDVGNEVGKTHCIFRYSKSPTIQSSINQLISSSNWQGEFEMGQVIEQSNEFLINDPIQDLDESKPSIRAYLLGGVAAN